ncbi:MAG: ABC transporter permease [Nitrospinales bacterium]
MIAGIAWRNFYRQGIRAWLNVLVTGLTIVAVIFMLSLLNGFQAQATRNLVSTDVAGGHYRMPGFDLLTPTEWEDFTFPVPGALRGLSHSEKAEVLLQQGQIFPERRLFPVQLRGLEMQQTLLDLPLDSLKSYGAEIGAAIPVVLGPKISEKTHLKKGDTVVLRWRDRFGAVDARDVVVLDVADFINPRLNDGILWMRLDHLREITRRHGEVSWVAVKTYRGVVAGMEFHSPVMLMKDVLTLLKHDRRNSKIMWTILMFLAGIGIFNTQIMNVFKRQKEIGTFMAMGMTPRQIAGMFTLEGSFAALGALGVAVGLGIPFFIWFQGVGLDLSHLSGTTVPVRERLFLEFRPAEIVTAVTVIVTVMITVAWLPVRKILRLDPTLALRGKAVT